MVRVYVDVPPPGVGGRNYDYVGGGHDLSRDTVPLKFAFQREREKWVRRARSTKSSSRR